MTPSDYQGMRTNLLRSTFSELSSLRYVIDNEMIMFNKRTHSSVMMWSVVIHILNRNPSRDLDR